MDGLTPRQVVEALDKYIVGQEKAKKSVAIALRNRLRRKQLSSELRDEIMPKNILMIGPTGVGKTEIARRLAKLVDAPFIKIEATKFTEVGYVGRDVEAIIRDLVEIAIRMVKNRKMKDVSERAQVMTEERFLELLLPLPHKAGRKNTNILEGLFGGMQEEEPDQDEDFKRRVSKAQQTREELRRQLQDGELEDRTVEIEVESQQSPMVDMFAGSGIEEVGMGVQDMLGNFFPKKTKRRKVTIKDARKILLQQEAEKLIDMDEVVGEALEKVEQDGIVFLDEIDKIATGSYGGKGPDVSREGVQRDILPIVEGSTITTKYGPVKTDYILFIGAGAFHISKPSDLIPELQGRFPIRVELESLSKEDFKRILMEPRNALTKQYIALMETEGVKVIFLEEAIDELSQIAYDVNIQMENIGARRLHTIMEKLFDDLSFAASEIEGQEITINQGYVREKLKDIVKNQDLSRYIL